MATTFTAWVSLRLLCRRHILSVLWPRHACCRTAGCPFTDPVICCCPVHLPPRIQYMVALGIIGSGSTGLKSDAWTNQSPNGGWEGFFAGASNIIFTFGES